MNLSDIKKLIRMFESSELSKLKVEEEGLKVSMSKGGEYNPPPQVSTTISPAPQVADTSVQSAPQAEIETPTGHIIKSPMVGSFFRSPSPTSPPFVEKGDLVRPGDVLCIIEAMKLMNEIESDIEGKIVKIYSENGKPVEFDEPLFEIEPV